MKRMVRENGIDYVLVGDYYFPLIKLENKETRPIGKYGMLRKTFLSQYRRPQYDILLLNGDLDTYLADFNEQAQRRFEVIVDQMKQANGITDDVEVEDRLKWLQLMNAIIHEADEVIFSEMVYS